MEINVKPTDVDDDLLDVAEDAAMGVADMDVPLRDYLRAALAAVAPLIAAAERERCARVAETIYEKYVETPTDCPGREPSAMHREWINGGSEAAEEVAAAIRARSDSTLG